MEKIATEISYPLTAQDKGRFLDRAKQSDVLSDAHYHWDVQCEANPSDGSPELGFLCVSVSEQNPVMVAQVCQVIYNGLFE